MKPVQNSDDEEGLLLQSHLEYSNCNYTIASVFNKDYIRLRMESDDHFDEIN